MKEYLKEGIERLGIEYNEEKAENLLKYLELLMEYNSHTNLTAIRDGKGILEKHFLDSLLLQRYIQADMRSAIDIGTGAGFPGMVLAIYNPDMHFTLMDSVGKKTKFLEEVKETLNLSNVTVVNSRAEDYIDESNRESIDLGLCRGVSKLNTILEYVIPFLKPHATFLSQKMEGTGEEDNAETALRALNSHIEKIERLELPYCRDGRVVVVIKKDGETDSRYPRRSGIPLKKPL